MIKRIASFWLTAAICLGPGMVNAQTQGPSNNRTLNGHSFITTKRVGDPFVGTYLRTLTGAGRALDMQVPVYRLDGTRFATLAGNIAFFQLGIDYQQRLADWVAVRATFGGLARLGTNHVALIAEGATATYGGSVGATFRLAEHERYIVSAIAEARSNSLYAISPLEFAQNVAASGGIDSTTQLLDSGSNWRLIGGVRGAYAFSPSVGISGLVEFGPASRFFEDAQGNRNTSQFSLGAASSFDLNPEKNVPIGFALSVLYQSENERGDDVAGRQTTFGLGVFYTGRVDLSVGPVFEFQRFRQRDLAGTVNVTQAKLLLRYDF